MTYPKITIITCTKNSHKHLAECLDSVKNQTYQPFEHIFIDNLSDDGTLEIIREKIPQAKIISEKDFGLYEAVNKGLALVAGDCVGILNSDDIFYDNDCLKRVAESFRKNPNLGFYCATMEIYDENLKEKFAVLGGSPCHFSWRRALYSSNNYAHETYYVSRAAVEKVGKYDENLRLAGDIDWLLRLEKIGLPYFFDQRPFIKFRSAGLTAKKYFSAWREEFLVRAKQEGFSARLFIVYSYHFFRRAARFFLEKIRADFIVKKIRKIILKLK